MVGDVEDAPKVDDGVVVVEGVVVVDGAVEPVESLVLEAEGTGGKDEGGVEE